MIKIINMRSEGSLYHYAHFICDCLFPEIINDIFKYKKVIREKTLHQTIGNFSTFYSEIMTTKSIELPSDQFNALNIATISYKNKEEYLDKIYFEKFRKFIFSKYNINCLEYNKEYPEVILIKRGDRIKLINDECLNKIDNNFTTGKERREIYNINYIEDVLNRKFGDKFKCLYFENMPFEKQVLYFNNAKMIVCAHGAVMANMFFCKEQTIIIEVPCKTKWAFFGPMTKILNLVHIKCKNVPSDILNCIEFCREKYNI